MAQFLWSLKRQDDIREKEERLSLDKRDSNSGGSKDVCISAKMQSFVALVVRK